MTTISITDDVLQVPAVGPYGIDPRASAIMFKSRHLDVSLRILGVRR
jgi:hypothetical protein